MKTNKEARRERLVKLFYEMGMDLDVICDISGLNKTNIKNIVGEIHDLSEKKSVE